MTNCDHNYRYLGMTYDLAKFPLPGSGAHTVNYYTVFYCTKCLHEVDKFICEEGNSYEKIRHDATPRRKS